jgi:dUTPase
MKPIFIQPLSENIKHLPESFNKNEYDTLSALNLPFNSTGVIAPNETVKISLGYRMMIPSGCIGVMKERAGITERYPIQVLSGILDCNTIKEDAKLSRSIEIMESFDIHETTRLHPETFLLLRNCGSSSITYTSGDSWVQLFLVPICEAQVQVLKFDAQDHTLPPLRYDQASTTKAIPSIFSSLW